MQINLGKGRSQSRIWKRRYASANTMASAPATSSTDVIHSFAAAPAAAATCASSLITYHVEVFGATAGQRGKVTTPRLTPTTTTITPDGRTGQGAYKNFPSFQIPTTQHRRAHTRQRIHTLNGKIKIRVRNF